MARCVDDLRIGLDVMTGSDGIDSEVPPLPIVKKHDAQRPLRIAWWDDLGGLPLRKRTRNGLARTMENLEAHGFEIERRRPENFYFERAWYAYGIIIIGAEAGLGMRTVDRKILSVLRHFFPATQIVSRHFLLRLTDVRLATLQRCTEHTRTANC